LQRNLPCPSRWPRRLCTNRWIVRSAKCSTMSWMRNCAALILLTPPRAYAHSRRSARRSIPCDGVVSVPYLIAHRGSHEPAPENSLAAMSAAMDASAEAVEIDVHVTHDGVLVVHHDPVVHVGSGSNAPATLISELRYE